MNIFMKFIGKSMLERKTRLILLVFAIAMSTALFIGSIGAVETGLDSFIKPITASFEGMEIRIESEENGLMDISKMDTDSLDRINAYVSSQGIYQTNNLETVNFYGMDQEWTRSKNWIEGDMNAGISEHEALVSQRTKEELGLQVGDTVEVLLGGNVETFEIAGIIDMDGIFYTDTKEQFSLVAPLATAQELFEMGDLVNRVTATSSLDTTESGIATFNDINEAFHAQEIIDMEGAQAQIDQITSIFYGMLIIVVLMSSFIIYGSFKLLITERLPIIGTFFSQGATKGNVRRILYMESGLYGVLGGIIGSGLGIGILYLIHYFLAPLRDYGIIGSFEFETSLILAGIIFAVFLSMISCTVPIIKSGRMQVKNVILSIEEQHHKKGILGFIIGILLLLGITVSVYLELDFVTTLSPIMLLGSVISIILIYPRVLSFCTPKIFKGMKSFSGTTALGLHNVESSKSLRGNITLLIMSILAMVAINSVSTSLQSIVVDAFTDMNYDYSVEQIRMQDPESIESLKNTLAAHPKISDDSLHEIMLGYGKLNTTNSLVMGIDPEMYRDFNPYLGFNEGDTRIIYERFLEDPEGKIIVSKNTAAINGIQEGEILPLEVDGRVKDFEVAGIVDGKLYYNGSFIMIDNQQLRDSFHYSYTDSIYFHAEEMNEAFAEEIEEISRTYGARVMSVDASLERNLDGNRQMMNILSIFSIMAVVIGAFGALNNIIISFIQRKKDLAILSSLGMTQGQRSRMIFIESGVTVLWAILFITPYGYLMARLITALTAMIGLPIPIEFHIAGMIPFFLAAFLLFILATLPVVMKSRKLSVIREIQYE